MPSGYPAAIDNFNNPSAIDNLSTATVLHNTQHTNVNDAVKAIQTELGLAPKGTALSVKARLDAIDQAIAARALLVDEGAVNGIAQLDASGMLAQNIDAGKITSGSVAVARIPNLSGAKVFGTAGGGVAIPVDAVPALDAAKTTTGVFLAARIPVLDASKITTGTIPAARLPSTVTANANVVVKADNAGRDAIALADRVDGMLVLVRNPPKTMYVWNATTSAWDVLPDERNQWALATANIPTPLSGLWGVVGVPFAFNVISGFNYAIEGWMMLQNSAASAPDIKFGWGWTGTGIMSSSTMGLDPAVATNVVIGPFAAAAFAQDSATPMQPAAGVGVPAGPAVSALIKATYQCTGSGIITLQFGQLTADASWATSIVAGSRMKCERMS